MNPPAIGPTNIRQLGYILLPTAWSNVLTGAKDGVPMTIHDAAARSCTLNASPITADTIVITAEPPIPANSLITIKLGMFGANEQPKSHALKNAHDALITGTLPYISDKGARNSGPKA